MKTFRRGSVIVAAAVWLELVSHLSPNHEARWILPVLSLVVMTFITFMDDD